MNLLKRCTCWKGVPAKKMYLLKGVPVKKLYLLKRCTCSTNWVPTWIVGKPWPSQTAHKSLSRYLFSSSSYSPLSNVHLHASKLIQGDQLPVQVWATVCGACWDSCFRWTLHWLWDDEEHTGSKSIHGIYGRVVLSCKSLRNERFPEGVSGNTPQKCNKYWQCQGGTNCG